MGDVNAVINTVKYVKCAEVLASSKDDHESGSPAGTCGSDPWEYYLPVSDLRSLVPVLHGS